MDTIHFGTGGFKSSDDSRTIRHEDMQTMSGIPLITGGYDYAPSDIEMQAKVGICTAISLTQNAAKVLGKKFSADFQYLMQKKMYDGNWYEGSSILIALKVGVKYGFLSAELWTATTDADRELPYQQYIAKLQAIPDIEIQRLISLCTDKLTGYASVDVSNAQSIAKGITDSQAGILCLYSVGTEWYTAQDGRISWAASDINPIRPPHPITSGHAITASKFNFATVLDIIHPNTWSTAWCEQGLCDILWEEYKMVEAWIPYYHLTAEQTQELKDKLYESQTTLISLLKSYVQILKDKLAGKV